jgi:hypothetical protein
VAGDHVLRTLAGPLEDADADLAPLVTWDLLDGVAADVPDEWLTDRTHATSAEARSAYVDALLARLEHRGRWLPALEQVRVS